MLGSFQEFQHRPTVSSKLSTFAAKEEHSEAVTLKVMSGDDKHPVRMVTLPATIGRPTGASGLVASDSNALFNNSLISRKHAVIHTENKQIFVTDLGSSNGTYLNGVLLKANLPYRLTDGDLLQFGIDDEGTSFGKERLVVLQVKTGAPPKAPSQLGWTDAGKRTFSPGRILQEARNILSRPSKSAASLSASISHSMNDLSLPHRSGSMYQSQMFLHHNDQGKVTQETCSKLIALAQRLVETAETAKSMEFSPLEPLQDLALNVEASLSVYREHQFDARSEASVHFRPNLADARKIIRNYELLFGVFALIIAIWLFCN